METRPAPVSPGSDAPSRKPRSRPRWSFECLEGRTLLAINPVVATPAQLASATPITSGASGLIVAGQSVFFQLDASSDELLIAQAQAGEARTRLSLLDAQGDLLTQSDGLSTTNPADLIAQHLSQGTYYLALTGLGGSGDFSLSTQQGGASEPGSPISLVSSSSKSTLHVITGDFTGNGRIDLAVGYATFGIASNEFTGGGVAILLGNGDGTFQPPVVYAAGYEVTSMAVGDFSGNGRLDIAAGTIYGVLILLGNGDGTFQQPVLDDYGEYVYSIALGDFSGNGRLDIAAGTSDGVSILMGNGDGTFQQPVDDSFGDEVTSLAVGDFTGDGRLDLVAGYQSLDPTNNEYVSGAVSVLLGNGDGTFQTPVAYAVGDDVTSLAVGDFNGDGRLDLAVGYDSYDSTIDDFTGGAVSVLLGNGNGTFQAPVVYAAGGYVTSLAVGDLDGNGRLDIAAGTTAGVTLLVGNGDGTFQASVEYVAGDYINSLTLGDFTGDGRLGIAVGYATLDSALGEFTGGRVSVLLGTGDGTFQGPVEYQAEDYYSSTVVGDFTGNGQDDVAVGYYTFDPTTNQYIGGGVSVLLSNGDGTFQPPVEYTAGGEVTSLAIGDFSGDGRLDIVAGYQIVDNSTDDLLGSGVSVLLGNGDGTFQPPVDYAVGDDVTSLVVGDFTGNGRLDIVAGTDNGVAVLLGNGDGTFQSPIVDAAEEYVTALAVGDFSGDGRLDIATVNESFDPTTDDYVNGFAVLLSNGDGTFQSPVEYVAGGDVTALAVGDFSGNHRLDIAAGYQVFDPTIGDYLSSGVSVFLGSGNGTFQSPVEYAAGDYVSSLAVGDFTGNGRLDIAAGTIYGVSVLLGNGDGTFQAPVMDAAGDNIDSLAVGDFTGNGLTDLAYVDTNTIQPSTLLNTGTATLSSSTVTSTPIRDNPLVADFTGNGTDDLTVIDQSGDILWRRGIPGQPGSYEPPTVVNPGAPSRDITIVSNGGRNLIASVDKTDDKVSLYAFEDGRFVLISQLFTGSLPSQIITANLTDDGIADLIVRNSGDGTVSIYLGDRGGGFTQRPSVAIGQGASDIAAADLSGSRRDDLVVTNQVTGDVRVFPNILPRIFGPASPSQFLNETIFGTPSIYQAGGGPYSLNIEADGSEELNSNEATAGVAAGLFTPGGSAGLAVVNPGTNTLSILDGLGGGTLANARVYPTIAPGSIVRTADLRNDGITDLVVLTATGLDVYLGDGKGGFSTTPEPYDVGPDPTGLTIADVTGNGKLDLLIGNQYGDVLILLGNGDGTFRPFESANHSIALAVADLDGQTAFIYADQGLDKVAIQYGQASPRVVADQQQGLLAPGAVSEQDFTINGVTTPYLIVANSGGNDVLVYPGIGNGQFGPALNDGQGFFTGENPVSVTVASLDSNGLPDLVVADEGSNDVAVLLGEMQGNTLTFTPGPRLQAGLGPDSVSVENLPGNTYPDLLISDSQSNQVRLLKGLGQGFFDDQRPTIIPVGVDPGPLFVGNFSTQPGHLDLVTVNPGSDSLSFVADFLDGGSFQIIDSGGIEPVAGLVVVIDGEDDLLVANEGDGTLALFLAGPDGFDASPMTLEDPSVPNPTALAYDALSGDVLQFYTATAGTEQATLLQFNLGQQDSPGDGIASPAPPSTSVVTVDVLQPLGESSLAIVSTLLTTTAEVTSAASSQSIEVEVEASVAGIQGTETGLPNQPRSRVDQESMLAPDSADDDLENDPSPTLPAQDSISPLNRFLYRLDEAIEKARQDVKSSILGTPGPLGSVEPSLRLLDTVLARWSSTQAVASEPSPAFLGNLMRVEDFVPRAIDRSPDPSFPDDRSGPALSGPTSLDLSRNVFHPTITTVVSLALTGMVKLSTDGSRIRGADSFRRRPRSLTKGDR